MNPNKPFFKLLSVCAVLSLLFGCAVWTGGLPPSYSNKEAYPTISSVHGIKEFTYSDNLHKIIISYTPTNEIVLNTNTTHGWIIHIQPTEKTFTGREYYILPKAAQWGSKERPVSGLISQDQTTCVHEFVVPKGVKYLEGGWGMFTNDPLGQYRIVVILDDKLAADFRFRVIGRSKS